MAVISVPAEVLYRSIGWKLDRPAQVHGSAYTAKRTVVANPWHGKWYATVEMPPAVDATVIRKRRSFLTKLKGQTNTFNLLVSEPDQHSGSTPTASAIATAGATSIVLASPPAGLVEGMLATVSLPSGNKQMVMLTENLSGSTITFQPPLREAIAIGAAVETKKPYAQVALADSAFGWDSEGGIIYGPISFDVEEAINIGGPIVLLEDGGDLLLEDLA